MDKKINVTIFNEFLEVILVAKLTVNIVVTCDNTNIVSAFTEADKVNIDVIQTGLALDILNNVGCLLRFLWRR